MIDLVASGIGMNGKWAGTWFPHIKVAARIRLWLLQTNVRTKNPFERSNFVQVVHEPRLSKQTPYTFYSHKISPVGCGSQRDALWVCWSYCACVLLIGVPMGQKLICQKHVLFGRTPDQWCEFLRCSVTICRSLGLTSSMSRLCQSNFWTWSMRIVGNRNTIISRP